MTMNGFIGSAVVIRRDLHRRERERSAVYFIPLPRTPRGERARPPDHSYSRIYRSTFLPNVDTCVLTREIRR